MLAIQTCAAGDGILQNVTALDRVLVALCLPLRFKPAFFGLAIIDRHALFGVLRALRGNVAGLDLEVFAFVLIPVVPG